MTKTRQEQIEFIRGKCVDANESIKDLVFGCEVVHAGIHFMVVGTFPTGEPITVKKEGVYNPSKPPGVSMEVFQDGRTEIIGRDIRLADVLHCLRARYDSITDELGFLLDDEKEEWRESIIEISLRWNLLKDNLEDQSDDTVLFIFNLLSQ